MPPKKEGKSEKEVIIIDHELTNEGLKQHAEEKRVEILEEKIEDDIFKKQLKKDMTPKKLPNPAQKLVQQQKVGGKATEKKTGKKEETLDDDLKTLLSWKRKSEKMWDLLLKKHEKADLEFPDEDMPFGETAEEWKNIFDDISMRVSAFDEKDLLFNVVEQVASLDETFFVRKGVPMQGWAKVVHSSEVHSAIEDDIEELAIIYDEWISKFNSPLGRLLAKYFAIRQSFISGNVNGKQIVKPESTLNFQDF